MIDRVGAVAAFQRLTHDATIAMTQPPSRTLRENHLPPQVSIRLTHCLGTKSLPSYRGLRNITLLKSEALLLPAAAHSRHCCHIATTAT